MAGQPSFFDRDERYGTLSAAGDPLERPAAVVEHLEGDSGLGKTMLLRRLCSGCQSACNIDPRSASNLTPQGGCPGSA